jgi:hypothetical protein
MSSTEYNYKPGQNDEVTEISEKETVAGELRNTTRIQSTTTLAMSFPFVPLFLPFGSMGRWSCRNT